MILDEILARTRADLAVCQQQRPLAEVTAAARAQPPARGFGQALRRAGQVTCIAEFKRRSPSAGWIRQGVEPAEMAATYAAAGAAAMSVLTDQPFFGGSLDDLRTARAATPALPILRKDFMVDRYQVAEARAAGADAILLIVAALDDGDIARLLQAADDFGVDALVEAHDEPEVRRAVALGARIVGVNNRDLKTFTMDRELCIRLRPLVPPDRVMVAESGIRDAADVRRLGAAGIDAVLVGETLMRAIDPGAALRGLLA
ncbi:MAG TPA: indole-3-glycerol phosphate synthase TrpC [Polyangia bacterium]|jgi:indole-3-glycerol phosphate synthase|nr:indole-3-glycerol phosphate synthase TrpC [Polyangia bacterium]